MNVHQIHSLEQVQPLDRVSSRRSLSRWWSAVFPNYILYPGRYSVDLELRFPMRTLSIRCHSEWKKTISSVPRSLLLIFSRNGNMTLIIDCTECRISLIYKERCCPSMILDLILAILRVSVIEQVWPNVLRCHQSERERDSLLSFSDDQTGWRFDNSSLASKSSIRLLGGSLRPNRAFQMMIDTENRRSSSI